MDAISLLEHDHALHAAEASHPHLIQIDPARHTPTQRIFAIPHHPVLVIQTDLLNRIAHPSSIILPITSHTQDEAAPLRVRIPAGHPGFDTASDIMIDQIRAIDNCRFYRGNTSTLIKKIAPANVEILREIERYLLQVLDISGQD